MLRRLRAPVALALLLLALPAAAAGQETTTPAPAPVPSEQPAPAPVTPNASVRPEVSRLWAFVDRRAEEIDSRWNPALGVYVDRGGKIETRLNANMLVIHASAALADHEGSSRRDARVGEIVDVLTHYPAYVASARRTGDNQWHVPGWFSNARRFPSDQHISIDPQIAEGLEAAWRAREIVGLDRDQVARIQAEIGAVAWSRWFRWPSIRLNQFNWSADLYAADATVNRRNGLLQVDYRRRLTTFLDYARRPQHPGWSGNLNAGLGFRYHNMKPPNYPMNAITTSEYANIVFHGLQPYERARLRAGMEALGARRKSLLKAWAQRLLMGEWTHAGYLNWDTGHHFERWHLTRYWVFALGGLSTLGQAPVLSETERRWARWMLGQALKLYDRYQGDERQPGMPSVLFGIRSPMAHPHTDAQFIASRVGALIAEEALARFDEVPATMPPSLFTWDPDIRRFAVTTPVYSAAITDGTFKTGYGGADLARLYDGSGRPLGSIGSKRTYGFELRVTTRGGVYRLDTQRGVRTASTLRLAGHRGLRGTFERVGLDGVIAGRSGTRVRVSHRFTRDRIEREYQIRGPRGGYARVRLPVWSRFEKPSPPKVEPAPGGGGVRVDVRQSAGGYSATVKAAGRMRTAWRHLTRRERTTPGTTGLMEVVVPIPASGLAKVRVVLTPDPVER